MSDPAGPRILYADLETAPSLAWVWSRFVDGKVIDLETETYVLCFAALWEGRKRADVVAQPDFPSYAAAPFDDSHVIAALWEYLDEADIVVGHNWRGFDRKVANTRFAQLKLGPPSPYKVIDTLTLARSEFRFSSNRLGDLCEFLGIGAKTPTGGFALWQGCMNADEKSWETMRRYNRQDVALLPELLARLRPYARSHPNVNIYAGDGSACPTCGADAEHLTRNGTRFANRLAYQQWHCGACGAWPKSRLPDKDRPRPELVN